MQFKHPRHSAKQDNVSVFFTVCALHYHCLFVAYQYKADDKTSIFGRISTVTSVELKVHEITKSTVLYKHLGPFALYRTTIQRRTSIQNHHLQKQKKKVEKQLSK